MSTTPSSDDAGCGVGVNTEHILGTMHVVQAAAAEISTDSGLAGCIEAKCSLSASLSHCVHFWALSAAHCAQASSIECNFVCSLN